VAHSPADKAISARWIGRTIGPAVPRLQRTAASRTICMSWRRTNNFDAPDSSAVRRDIQRLAAEPDAAVADIHLQHDRNSPMKPGTKAVAGWS